MTAIQTIGPIGVWVANMNKFDTHEFLWKNTEPTKKPLTFQEWWKTIGQWSYGNYMEEQQAEDIWNAAQENM